MICCGLLLMLATLSTLVSKADNIITENDNYNCVDSKTYAFADSQLPSASAKLTREKKDFNLADNQIEPGMQPRIDTVIFISLSGSTASEDLGIVAAHVNGKTFIQIRIEPDVNQPENTLWTTATLTENTVKGRFNSFETAVNLSNYLQYNSLARGTNTLEISLENIRGTRLETAKILHPTQLVVDARSPQLLSLGIAAEPHNWYLDHQASLEVVVSPKGGCTVDGVLIDVVPGNDLAFDKYPKEPLDPVNVATQPIAARFGITPREIGKLDFFVTAKANGQEEAVALVTRSVVERGSSRFDTAQPFAYVFLGLLAALGVWLLLSSRRQSVSRHVTQRPRQDSNLRPDD